MKTSWSQFCLFLALLTPIALWSAAPTVPTLTDTSVPPAVADGIISIPISPAWVTVLLDAIAAVEVGYRPTGVGDLAKSRPGTGLNKAAVCPVCHKHLSNGLKQRHLSTHTGIKRYECVLCRSDAVYRSGQRSNIKRHLENVHGRKGDAEKLSKQLRMVD